MTVAEATVVIPTIGRPALLVQALESLAECEPRPAEVLVVDQSDQLTSAPITESCALPARTIASRGRGRGLACNEGLQQAAHELVLFVDDDCTVRSDWVEVARQAMRDKPDGIVSGRVLPVGGNASDIAPIIALEEPRDYTGTVRYDVLYAGNMACSRDPILDFGGFDERIVPTAEDCELCYRWLRAGRSLRHVPELVVWHQDWRSPTELQRQYVNYYRGLGVFYAKHLLAGDLTVLRFLGSDYYRALRGHARRGVFAGLSPGLWAGWREYRPASRRPRTG